jgi:excisionase family DNA binding protein
VKNDLPTTAAHAKSPRKLCLAVSTGNCAPPTLHSVLGNPPLSARRSTVAAPAVQSRSGPGAGRDRPGNRERAAGHSPEPQATQARGADETCPPSRASGRDRAFRTPPRPTTAARLPCLLGVNEVAALLQVSSKTVRRWIERQELRTHRLGRQLRVAEEDLTTFLAQRRK